ncbi:SemiSWEET transporter [Lacibacterium aquatile]|uniref:SemiSWEET transporter n=1 Tax=Lacibacterium aquatile TaxID=1168082 RepID=A0ABW5DUS3_9PROT
MSFNLVQFIGLVAAMLTTAAFFPQAIRAVRTRDTSSISLATYCAFVAGVTMWLVYGIIAKDIPIMVANALTLVPAATILGMKLRYG